MEAVIEVVTEDQFRVHCTSTGGRVLNMSVAGPHGVVYPLSIIQPVGTQRWMGDDSYFGVTATLKGANDGDTYNCTATNGISFATDSIEIRGNFCLFFTTNIVKCAVFLSCQQTKHFSREGLPH